MQKIVCFSDYNTPKCSVRRSVNIYFCVVVVDLEAFRALGPLATTSSKRPINILFFSISQDNPCTLRHCTLAGSLICSFHSCSPFASLIGVDLTINRLGKPRGSKGLYLPCAENKEGKCDGLLVRPRPRFMSCVRRPLPSSHLYQQIQSQSQIPNITITKFKYKAVIA